jgi:hypothetical protein
MAWKGNERHGMSWNGKEMKGMERHDMACKKHFIGWKGNL